MFEESIASMLDRYVSDQRLKGAIACQGTIGTFAGPRDPGTASIRLMHHQGDLLGLGSVWGYVEGGLGRVSFSIAQAALEAGATLAAGVPVAAIRPGEGVELESGELLRASAVVCNADPKRMLAMLDAGSAEVPAGYRDRLEGWDVSSPVLKLNVALRRFPAFSAANGAVEPQRAMVTVTDGVDAAQAAAEAARRGEPADRLLRALLPVGLRPLGGPRGPRGDERLLPVRPLRARRGRVGDARATRSPGWRWTRSRPAPPTCATASRRCR